MIIGYGYDNENKKQTKNDKQIQIQINLLSIKHYKNVYSLHMYKSSENKIFSHTDIPFTICLLRSNKYILINRIPEKKITKQ